ncbi:hypothetical protein GCM10027446_03530 [Angustibacter peucedani]
MTVTPTLRSVVLDVPDVAKAASFYTALTGWEVTYQDDEWVSTATGAGGLRLCFQRALDHQPPQWPGQERPQQVHLDLQVEGHEAAAERAVGLGASRLADGASWMTLADPDGHPFDLCQADGIGAGTVLYAATIDAPDASALARFYADLLGTEVGYDGPEGALVAFEGGSLMFQQVEGYTPPQWPDPAHPQQAHLDLAVTDLAAAEPRALELGAVRVGEGDDWRVYTDPAGHPFCLCL